MHLNRLKCYHQSRQICISFGMHLADSQRRTVKAPVMISASQRLDAYIKILESHVNILNITLVISPMGLFRWEKLKMRKHLKAQVCRQKSNINEGNKETSEEEWMMSFIANLRCTLFLCIKKNPHKCSCVKLLDWCKKRIQLGCKRGSSKTDLPLSSCCPINTFKYLWKVYV